MVQILLIVFGLFVLIKGNLKVSDTKKITRPQSIYWGLIIIAYGIAVHFLPAQLIYGLIFYCSLILISVIFMAKGETISSGDTAIKSKDTKRNLIILLIFIAIIAVVFYFFFHDIQSKVVQKKEMVNKITEWQTHEGKHFFFDYDCQLSDKAKEGRTYEIWWSNKIIPGDINQFFPDDVYIENEKYGSGYVDKDNYILESPVFICSSYAHSSSIVENYCLFTPEKDKLGYVHVANYEETENLSGETPYLCIQE